MAENRSTADDAATAVPTTRTGEPEQSGPARKRTTKASKAAEAGEPASADAPKKPAKRTKAAKAAKATKSTGPTASSAADAPAQPAKAASKATKAAAKSTKSAKPAAPAQAADGATEQPELEPTKKASKSTSRRPAKRTASEASVPAPRTESTDAPVESTDAPVEPTDAAAETLAEPTDTPIETLAEPSTTLAGPSEPAPPLVPVERRAGARPAAAGPATPGAWTAAAWASVQDPGEPPRRLVELVVAELGPRAAAWAGWLRATYPDPPAHGLVRLAIHQAGQLGWPLAIVGASGPVAAAVVSVPVMAWVRASVVLRVAAAYGHDPTDPRRVEDLLVLLGLTGSADAGPAARQPKLGQVTGVAGRLGLARLALSRLGLRRTRSAKAVRILTTVTGHQESIERLAHRAARHYRPKTASV